MYFPRIFIKNPQNFPVKNNDRRIIRPPPLSFICPLFVRFSAKRNTTRRIFYIITLFILSHKFRRIAAEKASAGSPCRQTKNRGNCLYSIFPRRLQHNARIPAPYKIKSCTPIFQVCALKCKFCTVKNITDTLPLRNLPFSLAELCVRYDMLCAVLESTTSVSTPS